MKIRPFGVEMWMNRFETRCEFNLAETCVDSLTVAELLSLGGRGAAALEDLLPLRLTYGEIPGSLRLRRLISALYERQQADNVLVTHGAIGANALVHAALVEPGDEVVAVVPTYQQHYSIPESLGAEVRLLRLQAGQGFLPDLDALAALVTPRTRLIAINNPNNLTGAVIERPMLEAIVAIARSRGAWLLSDEVYRGVEHVDGLDVPAVADLYEKGISTGSMSKAYSLAGLRLGWITGPAPLIEAVLTHRDYTTISVGLVDDHLASLALEQGDAILARNRRIVRQNRATLAAFLAREPAMSWVPPSGGTTALLRYEAPVDSETFCMRLLEETGVMLVPGSVMDMEQHVRLGFANAPSVLEAGLERLGGFLRTL